MSNKQIEFYAKANLHTYEGKYVAIVDEKIVASGENAKSVFEEAKAKTGVIPVIAKIPTEDTFIFVAIKWK